MKVKLYWTVAGWKVGPELQSKARAELKELRILLRELVAVIIRVTFLVALTKYPTNVVLGRKGLFWLNLRVRSIVVGKQGRRNPYHI